MLVLLRIYVAPPLLRSKPSGKPAITASRLRLFSSSAAARFQVAGREGTCTGVSGLVLLFEIDVAFKLGRRPPLTWLLRTGISEMEVKSSQVKLILSTADLVVAHGHIRNGRGRTNGLQ